MLPSLPRLLQSFFGFRSVVKPSHVCTRKFSSTIVHAWANADLLRDSKWADAMAQVHTQILLPSAPYSSTSTSARTLASKSDLRVFQRAAINASLTGLSVFLQAPTGAGKSLCFQFPATVSAQTRPGAVTIVISPIVALIHDQVRQLRSKGIAAKELHGSISTAERNRVLEALLDPQEAIPLLYTTPETLVHSKPLQRVLDALVDSKQLLRFVFDEAHCITEWGNSFRPDYLKACDLKSQKYSEVPVTLMTATSSEETMAHLLQTFQLTQTMDGPEKYQFIPEKQSRSTNELFASQAVVIREVTDRSNLKIEVLQKQPHQAISEIAEIIERKEATIIYTLSRNEAEEVCENLRARGCHLGFYHGGMTYKKRLAVQKQWMRGNITTLVATVAFGMGIDHSHVRNIIHYSIPLSLTTYYQQIGRAGRDGFPATCKLYFREKDFDKAEYIVSQGDGMLSSTVRSELDNVRAFCTHVGCRRVTLYESMGHAFDEVQCSRNCNCGPLTQYAKENEGEGKEKQEVDHSRDSNAISKSDKKNSAANSKISEKIKRKVEYVYHTLTNRTKQETFYQKKTLQKKDILSRHVIQRILESEPTSIEELASMKGVGDDRARRFFDLLRKEMGRQE